MRYTGGKEGSLRVKKYRFVPLACGENQQLNLQRWTKHLAAGGDWPHIQKSEYHTAYCGTFHKGSYRLYGNVCCTASPSAKTDKATSLGSISE